jgi:hypothetical protein
MGTGGLTKDSVISIGKNQVSCDMGGETAILDSTSGVYFGLKGIGTRVWDLIQEPRSVKDVLGILLEEYDVEPTRCERDLCALLEQLMERRLIETRNEAIA